MNWSKCGECLATDEKIVRLVVSRLKALLNHLKICDFTSLLKTIESIKGPYAFVYYDKQNKCVYFGRLVFELVN